jgi:hypothetical protein
METTKRLAADHAWTDETFAVDAVIPERYPMPIGAFNLGLETTDGCWMAFAPRKRRWSHALHQACDRYHAPLDGNWPLGNNAAHPESPKEPA